MIKLIYYVPFDMELFAPYSIASIRSATTALRPEYLKKSDEAYILGYLRHESCPARFMPGNVRLLIETQHESDNIVVDANGCVRFHGRDYFIVPISLVYLMRMLNDATERQRRGIRPTW